MCNQYKFSENQVKTVHICLKKIPCPWKLALKAIRESKSIEEKTYKTIEAYPTSTLSAVLTTATNSSISPTKST